MLPLTREQRHEFCSRYMHGATLNALADEYGITLEQAKYLLRRQRKGKLNNIRELPYESLYRRKDT